MLNDAVIDAFGITEEDIERVAARERQELERRERLYRGGRPAPDMRGHKVILADDGIATGTTMRVAIAALKRQQPSRLVVAVPVAPLATCHALRREVDEVICLQSPEEFLAISIWYEDFTQTTDEEVAALLERAREIAVRQEK